jgi:methionyl aminopeptidase
MTEKDYSGAATSKIGKNAKINVGSGKTNLNKIEDKTKSQTTKLAKQNEIEINKNGGENKILENYRKAGKIAKQVKDYAKGIIRKDVKLSEIAEKIEGKIIELGGEIAFPVNLSVDDIAAHYTPTLKDEGVASGLLNVDIGVHVKGQVCDIAFSVDLSEGRKYGKLIEASENALASAIELVKKEKDKTRLGEIGKAINNEITKMGFSTIVNLSGHSLSEFEIHSGLTIPNYDNSSLKELGEGAFAIEPFATTSKGSGSIYEGGGSGIYHITGDSQVRDNFSREVYAFLLENKKTLPFSQRELEKRFGTRVLFALSNLKRAGIIEEYPQLIEKNHEPVSQAETSLMIYSGNIEVLCE